MYELLVSRDVLDHQTRPDAPRPVQRRLALVMRHLVARGRASSTKSVVGKGAGWVRAPLGGHGGNHYYLWYARHSDARGRELGLKENQIALGAVRHHDETDEALTVGALELLDRSELGRPEIFTGEQQAIAANAASTRVVAGQPGTGKTTALWLAVEQERAARVLYVTYGERLASEARRHFEAFAPAAMRVDVMTFAELLGLGEDAGDVTGSPARATAVLEQEIVELRRPLGPFARQPELILGELHANVVGRALPIAFRGRPASEQGCLSRAELGSRRGTELGGKNAEDVSAVAAWLADRGRLVEVTPGPLAARRAWERLNSAGPPAELEGVELVVVDEVQDLTLMESLYLVDLVAALRRRGHATRLLIAGDEGQTVRATDFDWGELGDLLHERLADARDRDRAELRANVRSPRVVAAVVEASWSLYKRLGRGDRPRGIADIEIDDATTGAVALFRCEGDDDLQRACALLTRAGGQLVVPTLRADGDALGPADAKGLDFELVGVLGAARAIHEVEQLDAKRTEAGDDRHTALHARGLIDGLRVAISRSTDQLVFLEESADDLAVVRRTLCREVEDELVEVVGSSRLSEVLDRDTPIERKLDRHIEAVTSFLAENPERALQRARLATGLRGRRALPGAVRDEGRRAEAAQLRGIAAAVASAMTEGPERLALLDESARWLRKAESTVPLLAVKHLRQLARHPGDAEAARDLLFLVEDEEHADLAHLERPIELAFRAWLDTFVPGELRPIALVLHQAFTDLEGIAQRLEGRYPAARARASSLQVAVLEQLVEVAPETALPILVGGNLDLPALEAVCHERAGRMEQAVERYLAAGRPSDALRLRRDIGDLGGALELAKELDPAVAALLEHASTAQLALDALSADDVVGRLTLAEHESLRRAFEATERVRKPVASTAAKRATKKR